MTETGTRARVIYVAGTMRSGTTVLGQVLASYEGALLLGETKPLMQRPADRPECDCGERFDTCPFWHDVMTNLDRDALQASTAEIFKIRSIPKLLWKLLSGRARDVRDQPVIDLLRRIALASDGAVIIDTNKSPVGILLWKLVGAEVHVAHAVRSPGPVAAAQAQPSRKSGVPQETRAKSYAVWVVYNAITLALRPLVDSYTIVRFNALRAAPDATLRRVWGRVRPEVPLAPRARTFFEYRLSHLVNGNPRRTRGSVEVR